MRSRCLRFKFAIGFERGVASKRHVQFVFFPDEELLDCRHDLADGQLGRVGSAQRLRGIVIVLVLIPVIIGGMTWWVGIDPYQRERAFAENLP
jgi:hypothetical protein